MIPDEIAPYFDVLDITVGNQSCMPHAGAFPATAFAIRLQGLGALRARAAPGHQPIAITIEERAYAQAGLQLAMPMTQIAMDIGITVVNKSEEPRAFECYVIGQTVRRDSPQAIAGRRDYMGAAEARDLMGRWEAEMSKQILAAVRESGTALIRLCESHRFGPDAQRTRPWLHCNACRELNPHMP